MIHDLKGGLGITSYTFLKTQVRKMIGIREPNGQNNLAVEDKMSIHKHSIVLKHFEPTYFRIITITVP